jgi:predicted DNA-binding transcriptional regulator YafY
MPQPRDPTKVQRLLDLIAVLTTRHYPLTRAQLWDEVEGYRAPLARGMDEASVRRTFERDKKELLELGFPLQVVEDAQADPEDRLRYRLSHRDVYLPYLRLVREGQGERTELEGRPKPSTTPPGRIAPEDAWVAAEALHRLRRNPALPRSAAAESAFRKLTFDLADPEAGFDPVEVILTPDDDEANAHVELLSRALRERRRARFRYHSMARDAVEDRRVEPHALLFKLNRWYLVAHDLAREADRVFRVSRMKEVALEDPAGAFEPPEVDLSRWESAEAWALPGDDAPPEPVDVRFHFPRSLWAERNDRGALVSEDADGSAVRRFQVRSADAFLRWILSLGGEASIEAPAELAQALEGLRTRVAALYAGLNAGPNAGPNAGKGAAGEETAP